MKAMETLSRIAVVAGRQGPEIGVASHKIGDDHGVEEQANACGDRGGSSQLVQRMRSVRYGPVHCARPGVKSVE